MGYPTELEAVIAEYRPDLVVLTGRDEPAGTFSRLLDAAQAGFRVVQLTEFYEYAFGRVPVEDLSHEWFMSVLHLYQRRYSRRSSVPSTSWAPLCSCSSRCLFSRSLRCSFSKRTAR